MPSKTSPLRSPQALPFSVIASVLLVLLVNLLALRLDAVIAWAVVAVTHATSLVACVFSPESAVAALTPWLPSAAAHGRLPRRTHRRERALSLSYLLLLAFSPARSSSARRAGSTSSEVTAMTDPTVSIAGTDKIVISHATKVIRRRTVLDDVSLELPRGASTDSPASTGPARRCSSAPSPASSTSRPARSTSLASASGATRASRPGSASSGERRLLGGVHRSRQPAPAREHPQRHRRARDPRRARARWPEPRRRARGTAPTAWA